MYSIEQLKVAHNACTSNEGDLRASSKCGCFYCLRIYEPSEIREWIDDRNGLTALCPYCGIDSVIGDVAGCPISKDFLEAMNKFFF